MGMRETASPRAADAGFETEGKPVKTASASSSNGVPVKSSATRLGSRRIAAAAAAPARVLASTSFLSAFKPPSVDVGVRDTVAPPQASVSSVSSAASGNADDITRVFVGAGASRPSRFFAAWRAASARSGASSRARRTARRRFRDRSPFADIAQHGLPSLPHRSRTVLELFELETCRSRRRRRAPLGFGLGLGARATHASVSSVTIAHSLKSRCVRAGNA